MTDDTRTDRRRRGWAIALFGLVVGANVVYVVAAPGLDGHPMLDDAGHLDTSQVIGSLLTAALGVVLTWLRPRNAIGWLLSLAALSLALCNAGQNYGARALAMPDEGLPLGALALSLTAPLWIATVVLPASVLLVRYPTGAIAGRWPRRFDRAVIGGYALLYVGYAASPNSVGDEVAGREPPVLLPELVRSGLAAVGGVLLLVGTVLIIGDAVRRVVRSDPRERAALLLLLVTTTTAGAVIFADRNEWSGALAYASVLVAVSIGVLRYQALGIELVVRRTLLYAMLTGLVLVAFVGITAGLAHLVPTGPTPQVLAAALIAVGLAPARERLQGLVDRMLYGDRDDPAAALKRLGSSMGSAPSEGLLLAVVANLAEGLRLDGARIARPDGSVLAEWGASSSTFALPLSYAGEDLGRLEVGTRRGETTLSRADRQLLDTVTPLIAAVVHASRLTDELRTERNRVVDATQAERQRLRQELHDGLGPSLTGIGLGLEAVSALPVADEPRTAELVSRLRSEVASSLEEIRRIIDDLRPVSLDGSDLVTALRRRTSVVAAAGLEVRFEAGDDLPPLPPEVETAALRIADEALTNVVRHASARRCTVELTVADRLRLVVADDGTGLETPEGRAGGVGLGSMRDRAIRLGGTLRLEPLEPGTAVVAELPLAPVPQPQRAVTR